jgi:hypothetical protein
MWSRDEARPTVYRGTLFRSAIEAKVAEELDRLIGPECWWYEVPVRATLASRGLADDQVPPYLPDFTIGDVPEDLDLPLWIEVKPASLLYSLRDHIGCEERFDGIRRSHLTADDLQDARLDELWKPKRLAETTKEAVLVVSALNRNRTLSVLLAPDVIELSRSHPAVCHRQVLIDRDRAEREAEWRAEAERRTADREAERLTWWRSVVEYAQANARPARLDDWCRLCDQRRSADSLVIYRHDNRWVAVCRTHLEEGG